jgi:hypothetical protein
MSNKGTADSSGREYCTAAAGPARWMDGAEGPKRRRRTPARRSHPEEAWSPQESLVCGTQPVPDRNTRQRFPSSSFACSRNSARLTPFMWRGLTVRTFRTQTPTTSLSCARSPPLGTGCSVRSMTRLDVLGTGRMASVRTAGPRSRGDDWRRSRTHAAVSLVSAAAPVECRRSGRCSRVMCPQRAPEGCHQR